MSAHTIEVTRDERSLAKLAERRPGDVMTGDWLPLAQRVLSCEWADDGWCETHDDPWPCDRAQEAADVLAEELDQPTKEQKMGKTTDDEGGLVRCGCGRAVPCRHCPTTPTPIDPADIRPGDVVERAIVDRITVTANERDMIHGIRPGGKGTGISTDPVYWADVTTWHLVSRPDPDAEAVEAIDVATARPDDRSKTKREWAAGTLAALREQGWDVVRRAES